MSESKSAYGRGFAIRLTLLLVVLAGVAGLFYYEKNIAQEKHIKKLDGLINFVTTNADGLKRAAVREHVGLAPTLSEKRDKFDVDRYSFRTLPFLPGQDVYVVFDNEIFSHYTTNEKQVTAEFLKDSSRIKPGVRTVDVIPEPALPSVAGGGPPGSVDSAPGAGDGGDEGEAAGNDEGDAAEQGDAGKEGDAAGDQPAGDGENAGEGSGDDGRGGDPPTSGDAPKPGDGTPADGGGNAA